jgi:hypothetical protein
VSGLDGVRAYQSRGRVDQQIEFVSRGETGIGNSKEIWTHEQEIARVPRPEESLAASWALVGRPEEDPAPRKCSEPPSGQPDLKVPVDEEVGLDQFGERVTVRRGGGDGDIGYAGEHAHSGHKCQRDDERGEPPPEPAPGVELESEAERQGGERGRDPRTDLELLGDHHRSN